MTDRHPRGVRVLHQPPSVDFIENRLTHLLPPFEDSSVRYDQRLKRFTTSPEPVAMPGKLGPRSNGDHGNHTMKFSLQDRMLPPPIYAMKFWDTLFEESMAQLKVKCPQEPERLREKYEYSIRTRRTWEDVHSTLQDARILYDGSKSRFLGHLKGRYRRLADHSAVASQTLAMVPDGDYVSPVKAAVQVLVEASLSKRPFLDCANSRV